MADCIISRLKFLDRVTHAKPGERIQYHVGSVMNDRQHGLDFLKVNSVAIAAWEVMEAGKVALAQRRITKGVYEYIAVKLTPPFTKVTWPGSYGERLL